MRHAAMVEWKGEEEETHSHQNTVDASSIILFLDLLWVKKEKRYYERIGYEKI